RRPGSSRRGERRGQAGGSDPFLQCGICNADPRARGLLPTTIVARWGPQTPAVAGPVSNSNEAHMPLKPATREKLKPVSTATIPPALFKRGLLRQMIQDVLPLDAAKPTMVGEAFTLRYMPAREDLNPITVFQDRGHPQRKAIEECPPGAVFVIDSR